MFILEKDELFNKYCICCHLNIMVTVCWSVCLSEVTKVNDPLNGLLNVYAMCHVHCTVYYSRFTQISYDATI